MVNRRKHNSNFSKEKVEIPKSKEKKKEKTGGKKEEFSTFQFDDFAINKAIDSLEVERESKIREKRKTRKKRKNNLEKEWKGEKWLENYYGIPTFEILREKTNEKGCLWRTFVIHSLPAKYDWYRTAYAYRSLRFSVNL